ncbi:MAG: hypothetical protein CVV49_19235 [Spirochaetae bacterium HGW-Spirochaetae-5]|jgi:hypothetical protein|nr:MAG: hypothetical protein CVV49_19235 [Spirochaetae bacterium HGW-Spirochaetae-5]
MGLLDKLDKAADEKKRARSQRDIEDLLQVLEDSNFVGLDDVLSGIHEIADSGLYKKLLFVYKSESERTVDRTFELDELKQVRVLRLARENLNFGGFLTTIFAHSLVTSKQFIMIHLMIQYTYVIFSGRNTTWNDILNVYFSGLDEKIIFALDDFDKVEFSDLPEPTPEYFQKLKKLKWQNKDAKNLYDNLREFTREIKISVLNYPDLDQVMGWISTYWVMEDLYIQTLAGCSAVNDGRSEIMAEDVVKAYKTFLKLLKTDVRKYKAIPERVQGIDGYEESLKSQGYLVCDKCGSYYKLESGESADDFEGVCDCGGHLVYKESI